jgi:hypothetical protein
LPLPFLYNCKTGWTNQTCETPRSSPRMRKSGDDLRVLEAPTGGLARHHRNRRPRTPHRHTPPPGTPSPLAITTRVLHHHRTHHGHRRFFPANRPPRPRRVPRGCRIPIVPVRKDPVRNSLRPVIEVSATASRAVPLPEDDHHPLRSLSRGVRVVYTDMLRRPHRAGRCVPRRRTPLGASRLTPSDPERTTLAAT